MRKSILIALVAATVIVLGAMGLLTTDVIRMGHVASDGLADPHDRRDFNLIDTSGQNVSLKAYAGKWLLLYFGFTNCPEACPLTLSNIETTIKEMGPYANKLQPIFITIDPERDTPAILKGYLANFGGNIAGLSGSIKEIAAVAKAYGVYYAKRPIRGGYTMDHSSVLYLLGPGGELVRLIDASIEPKELGQQLHAAMDEE